MHTVELIRWYTASEIQTKKKGERSAKALILEREIYIEIPILHEECLVKKYFFTLQENWAFVHYIQNIAFP